MPENMSNLTNPFSVGCFNQPSKVDRGTVPEWISFLGWFGSMKNTMFCLKAVAYGGLAGNGLICGRPMTLEKNDGLRWRCRVFLKFFL